MIETMTEYCPNSARELVTHLLHETESVLLTAMSHMKVDHRCVDLLVTQKRLDCVNAGAHVNQVSLSGVR
jgi:hypothetical protein